MSTRPSLLAQNILPISRHIRPSQELMFAREPDIIHDIFGHLPSLLSEGYRRLLTTWAQTASQNEPTELDQAAYHLNKLIVQTQSGPNAEAVSSLLEASKSLAHFAQLHPSQGQIQDRIYFWIFEFGMVVNRNALQILGAGILSSLTELKKIASSPIQTHKLSIDSVMASYNISEQQNEYLIVDNTEDYFHFLTTTSSKTGSTQAPSSVFQAWEHSL